MKRLAALAVAAIASGWGCADHGETDLLEGDYALSGDPLATTSDGRVHVLVFADGVVHVESGEPGGDWSLEPIAGVSDDDITWSSLASSGDSLHAVWESGYSSPYSIYYAAGAPGGGWSTPVDVIADLPIEMRSPGYAHIVASSTGEVALVWSSRQLGFSVARIAEGRLVGDPEVVEVPDAPGPCQAISRPAFDSNDRLVMLVHCRFPDEEPDSYRYAAYVVRDTSDGWKTESIQTIIGARSALGPDSRVHTAGLPGSACTGDDQCPEQASVWYVNSESAADVRVGNAATRKVCIAVDAGGTIYVSYWGRPGRDPVAQCEEDEMGCLATSADGVSFSEPRELPGAGSGRRSAGSIAMAPYQDGVVLVHCVGAGGCERLAVSILGR